MIDKEQMLIEEEKNNLARLYRKQINSLEQEIKQYNSILKSYREKILIVKSKIEKNKSGILW